MIDTSQISTLCYLLEDPDPNVYRQIKGELISYGPELIPELEIRKENAKNLLVQARIKEILHKIYYQGLCQELKFWNNNESYDLLKGVLLVCSYEFPHINTDDVTFTILNMKREITRDLTGLQPKELLLQFNKTFFADYGFRAINKERISPNNYFINHLISTRKGEVIALSLLYVILAKELNLPIALLNVPNNRCLIGFIKRSNLYRNVAPLAPLQTEVLFYIDPTRKGNIVPSFEVQRKYFKDNYLEWHELRALNNKEMIVLLLTSFRKYYEEIDKFQSHLGEIDGLIEILES